MPNPKPISKEMIINGDTYKYEVVKKTDKIQGFIVNKDNMVESYYLLVLYILGKINEKGYFIRYNNDETTFYIIYDYNIIKEDSKDYEIKQV